MSSFKLLLMALPKMGTKEWEDEVAFYVNSTSEQKQKRATVLYPNAPSSYTKRMRERGIHPTEPTIPSTEKPETPEIHLPPVHLRKYKPINAGRAGDPETMGIHLTDHHDCEITPTYNHDVYLGRLDRLFQSTIRILELHRKMYPINDLVIFITGDMAHGENPHQGAKVESIEVGVKNQIFSKVLPALLDFTLSLKQEFHTVKIYCVPGNHGRYSKEAPKSSNWDLILYEALKISLKPYNIDVEISDTFCLITEVQNHKFFLFHGDQCRATQGIPYFALTKKLMSWHATYDGFDYAICGHFHNDNFLRISSKFKLLMGASMVSDDPYALEVVGTSSVPSQWVFGIHKVKGITWTYPLVIGDEYFKDGKLIL